MYIVCGMMQNHLQAAPSALGPPKIGLMWIWATVAALRPCCLLPPLSANVIGNLLLVVIGSGAPRILCHLISFCANQREARITTGNWYLILNYFILLIYFQPHDEKVIKICPLKFWDVTHTMSFSSELSSPVSNSAIDISAHTIMY